MPRIKTLLRLATLGGAALAVVKRRAASAGRSGPAPHDVPEPAEYGPVTPVAPAPVEMPGPSVTPPAYPQSETERAEKADALKPDPEILAQRKRTADPDELLIAEEESAAAAEAAAIGGRVRHDPEDPDLDADSLDPAMQPVYEAGGGPAEGFEAAEADLVDNAGHGDGRANPLLDALTPEVESDLSGAEYGEPDHVHPADEDREDDDEDDDER